MIWGSFGIVCLASLLVVAGMIVSLYFLLHRRSDRVQTIVLGAIYSPQIVRLSEEIEISIAFAFYLR